MDIRLMVPASQEETARRALAALTSGEPVDDDEGAELFDEPPPADGDPYRAAAQPEKMAAESHGRLRTAFLWLVAAVVLVLSIRALGGH